MKSLNQKYWIYVEHGGRILDLPQVTLHEPQEQQYLSGPYAELEDAIDWIREYNNKRDQRQSLLGTFVIVVILGLIGYLI